MGIGRKSRKLKGKKRQTGRKIRRGTRRSRLGRMSLMKGGGDAAVEALGGVSSECDTITSLIDDLNGATKNLFKQQAEDANGNIDRLTAENVRLKAEKADILKRLEGEKQEAVAEERANVERLTSALKAAQAEGTKAGELERQLKAANLELEREKGEKEDVSSELAAAKTAADEAAAAVTEANKKAAAQKKQDEASIQQISAKFEEINAVVEKLRQSCIANTQESLINLIEKLREKGCLEEGDAGRFIGRLNVPPPAPAPQGSPNP